MSDDVIPIRPSVARDESTTVEMGAVRALAALYRLRHNGDAAASKLATDVIDFSRLESIPDVRVAAHDLNAGIDKLLTGEKPR